MKYISSNHLSNNAVYPIFPRKRSGKTAKKGTSKEQITVILMVVMVKLLTIYCMALMRNKSRQCLRPCWIRTSFYAQMKCLHTRLPETQKLLLAQSILPLASELSTISFIFKTSMPMIADLKMDGEVSYFDLLSRKLSGLAQNDWSARSKYHAKFLFPFVSWKSKTIFTVK